jgi:hypothetical protein
MINMNYNRINILLCACIFLFIGCEGRRKPQCNYETHFTSFNFIDKKAKILDWVLDVDTCNSMYTIKGIDGSFNFYQKEDSTGIYRIIDKRKFMSHSFVPKNIIYNAYSKPQSYKYLIINDKTVLIMSKVINTKKHTIIYVFKESTDTHKVCYSFYSKDASFFMYYNPDEDQITYPISPSNRQVELRKCVLSDTSLFLRNRLLRQRASIKKMLFRENASFE